MLYVLIGMGICISLFIIAFAFARAAAHADEHRDSFLDHEGALDTNDSPLTPAPEPTSAAPHVPIEAIDERLRRTPEHSDVTF